MCRSCGVREKATSSVTFMARCERTRRSPRTCACVDIPDAPEFSGKRGGRSHQPQVQTRGSGHIYQGRFKSFPVQDDDHLPTLCRYVERNALRANLVKRAKDWRCSSLYRWYSETAAEKELLPAWPLRRNAGWLEHVTSLHSEAKLAAIRRSVNRGSPFGDETWVTTATKKLGLEITTRPQGRPKLK